MRQNVFLFFVAMISIGIILSLPLTSASRADAALLSEYLESTLSSKSEGDFVSVLVFMNDRADVSSLQQRYKLASFTRQASHKILIDELQSFAQTAQTDILRTFNNAKLRGNVRSYESYWITNALQVEARKSFIETLRDRPDLAAIIEDLPMQSLYYPASQTTASAPTMAGVSPGLRAIHADSMWALGFTGVGSLIASFDTGVNGGHPALRNSYHGNHGYPAAACWFDPVYGRTYPHWDHTLAGGPHGTQTMGIMVGKDDATGDTVGVAFGADWISAMVVDIPHSNYLEAFQWVADPDGDPNTVDDVPDVLNNSWGFAQSNIGCLDIFWDPIDNVEAAGTVVVFSCGNSGPGPMTLRNPANRATTPYSTFSVGAVLATDVSQIWSGSSRGPSDCDGISIKPEVVAPGYQVRTINPADTLSYVTVGGTSFSAPHVAGAVALLRQYNPNAPVDSIKSALMRSAVDKGTPGEDNTFGWGVIDIPAAMSMLAPNNQINIYVQQVTHNPIKPGDSVDVVVTLRNSGSGTVGVTGQLASPGSGATILQGLSSFGDMGLNVSKNNGSSPYRIAFASSITQGTHLTVDLQIHDGFSYQRTIKLYFTVGTALVNSSYTHQTDSCRFTISNYGTYGLADGSISNKGGVGFAFPADGINNLFQCGLMIGADSNHVSDGVVNKLGSVDEDFAVIPGGNLIQYTDGVIGDVETFCRYADNRATNPLGVIVEQRTANFTNITDARYVIIEYVISNKSAMPINGAYVGIYCDWDFPWGSGGSDRTGFSREYGLGYLYQNGPVANSFRGTAVLNPEGVRTYWAIQNLGTVYTPSPNSVGIVSEASKYRFLTHGIVDTASLSPYDQSYCIATGPFNIDPGASDTACFVLMGGKDVYALQSAVLSARAHYRQATPVDDNGESNLPSAFELQQNFPNPFNPETVIRYTLQRAGQVSVAVYNLLGRQIAALVDETQNAGTHSIIWDGRDDDGKLVASGVYFYRLRAGDIAQTKKMILLK
jgi:subtilisin family serine protease